MGNIVNTGAQVYYANDEWVRWEKKHPNLKPDPNCRHKESAKIVRAVWDGELFHNVFTFRPCKDCGEIFDFKQIE